MQQVTLQQAADYLEKADIHQTIDDGFMLTHFGTNAAGIRFVLVNNASGSTVLVEQL